jgi:hypothetical protein
LGWSPPELTTIFYCLIWSSPQFALGSYHQHPTLVTLVTAGSASTLLMKTVSLFCEVSISLSGPSPVTVHCWEFATVLIADEVINVLLKDNRAYWQSTKLDMRCIWNFWNLQQIEIHFCTTFIMSSHADMYFEFVKLHNYCKTLCTKLYMLLCRNCDMQLVCDAKYPHYRLVHIWCSWAIMGENEEISTQHARGRIQVPV